MKKVLLLTVLVFPFLLLLGCQNNGGVKPIDNLEGYQIYTPPNQEEGETGESLSIFNGGPSIELKEENKESNENDVDSLKVESKDLSIKLNFQNDNLNSNSEKEQEQGISFNDSNYNYEIIQQGELSQLILDKLDESKEQRGFTIFRGYRYGLTANEYILMVNAGKKETIGYHLEIVDILKESDRTTVIVHERKPEGLGVSVKSLDYPYIVIKIEDKEDNLEVITTEGETLKEIE